MADHTVLEFQLERQPLFDVDPASDEAVRSWLKRSVEDAVVMLGELGPAFRFVSDGTHETVDLARLVDVDRDAVLAVAFRSLGERPGVRRRFRQGEVVLKDEEGRRRAAALLEILPATAEGEPERFWIAWRRFGEGNEHTGVFHGEWVESTGAVAAAPFDAWVDVADADVSTVETSTQPAEPADIRAAYDEIRPDVELPTDVRGWAGLFVHLLIKELDTDGLDGFLILAAKERHLQRWEVKSALPFPLDDLVRWIATQAEAEVVAVVHHCVLDIDGRSQRAIAIATEQGGQRADALMPIDRVEGKATVKRFRIEDRGPSSGEAWLGVPPKVPFDLTVMGVEDAQGRPLLEE